MAHRHTAAYQSGIMWGVRSKPERIADAIEALIRDGTYQPGKRLPAVAELVRLHRSSNVTVMNAVGLLRDRGLIDTQRNVGLFVVDPVPTPDARPRSLEERVAVLESRQAELADEVAAIRRRLGGNDGAPASG